MNITSDSAPEHFCIHLVQQGLSVLYCSIYSQIWSGNVRILLVSFRYDRCLSGNIFIPYLNLGLEGPSHGKLCDSEGFQGVGGET